MQDQIGPMQRILSKILGTIAVMFATINIVAGFLITDRMLKMFKKGDRR